MWFLNDKLRSRTPLVTFKIYEHNYNEKYF